MYGPIAFFFSPSSWMYSFTFFLVCFGFTFLDIQDTPKECSEYIVKIGARVPGVRPGQQTIQYFEDLRGGSRFFGGLLLGCVATGCTLADKYCRETYGMYFGLTSMLIVVSTILAIKKQVRALNQMPNMGEVLRSL